MKGNIYLKLFVIDALFELFIPLLFPQFFQIRFITKPLLMILLMLYVLNQQEVFQKNRILFALIFAWLGDVFLLIPGDNPLFFQLGLGSFLIMQITYIVLFIREFNGPNKVSWPTKWISLFVILCYILFFLNFLLPHIVAGLKLPVIVYAFALGSMLYFSWLRRSNCSKENFSIIVSGAFLFVVSDSLLAFGKFYYSFSGISFLVMITYISSQLLLIKGLVTFVPLKK
ncbi:lysoplasmalogenase [Aquirufa sp. ROCK2-A2]